MYTALPAGDTRHVQFGPRECAASLLDKRSPCSNSSPHYVRAAFNIPLLRNTECLDEKLHWCWHRSERLLLRQQITSAIRSELTMDLIP